MDMDFLEACARAAAEVQRLYPLIRVTSILAGFAVIGCSLAALRRRAEERRSVLPALAGLVIGAMLASVTAVLDALSLAIFRLSAPGDLAAVEVGSAHGLENMVRLALSIVMVVGAYQVVKGLVLLKEAAEGSRTFWPAVTHMAGGVLCLNIRPLMLALGATLGGSLEGVIQTLLGA